MAIIQKALVIEGHGNDVNALDVCANQLASGSSDKSVRVFKIKIEGELLHTSEITGSPLLGHDLSVTSVRFHSPYILLSCSIDGCVILWNTQEKPGILGRLSQKYDAPLRALSACLFNDLFAAAGDGGIISLWKGISYENIQYCKSLVAGDDDAVNTISFTSDGKRIVSGSSDGTIRLWDAEFVHSEPLATEYWAHELGVTASDIQEVHDEEEIMNYTLATGGRDDQVKLWRISVAGAYTISLKFVCQGHVRSVNGIKFSQQFPFLFSVGDDQMMFIWDSRNGSCLFSFETSHKRPGVLCCAVDENFVFTGSSDKTICAFKFTSSVSPVTADPPVQPKAFLQWSTVDVNEWIKEIGMEQYIQVFSDHRVNGFQLYHMNKNFLQNVLNINIPEHRIKILRAIQSLKSPRERPHDVDENGDCPAEFICPITREVMREPVVASDGFSYEKSALKQWFDQGNHRSPVTNAELQNLDIFPNYTLMSLIEKFNN